MPPREALRKATLISSLCFLVFFRPHYALRGANFTIDDFSYLSWLNFFLGKSSAINFDYFPGTALFWIPFAIVGQAIAKLLHESPREWIVASVGVTSFGLFFASAWLLFLQNRPKSVGYFLLSAPVLYYATSRAALGHSVEFFLACLVFFFIERKKPTGVLFAAILLVITRPNDFPVLLLPALLADRRVKLCALALICVCVGWFESVGYQGLTLTLWSGRVSRYVFVEMLSSSSWGLLFTAPWWLWTLWEGGYFFRRLTNTARAAWLWMLIELIVCTGWNGSGSDFGYRYLIGTFPAAYYLWMQTRAEIDWVQGTFSGALLRISCGWNLLLTWFFRTWPHYYEPMQLQTIARLGDLSTIGSPLALSPWGALIFTLVSRSGGFSRWEYYALEGVSLKVTVVMTVLVGVSVLWGRGVAFSVALPTPARNA